MRDENSRMTTGKKQTLPRWGDKKQNRLPNDAIKVVYDKFCARRVCSTEGFLGCSTVTEWQGNVPVQAA